MNPRDARLAWCLFGCLCALYLLTAGGHFYSSDGHQKFAVLATVLEEGTTAIDGGWIQGRFGLRYAWFPLGASLVMLPGYLVGRALAPWLPGVAPHDVERVVVALQNAGVTAALAVAMFQALRWMGHSARASLAAALAFGLGTAAWPYAKTCWSEPAATLALFLGLVGLWRLVQAEERPQGSPLRAWGVGSCLALALLIRQEFLVPVIGAAAWLGWLNRRGHRPSNATLVGLGVPLALGLGLHLAYEHVRWGAWLSFPNYRLPREGTGAALEAWRILEGVFRHSISPNQGLLFFSPAALLGLAGLRAWGRRCRPLVGLLGAALVPLFAFYVVGWGPSSWAWGMRYSYVFLPFLMLPAAELFERPLGAWARLCLGAGLVVQLVAVPYDFVYLYQRELAQHPGTRIMAIMSEPLRSPLLLALRALPDLGRGAPPVWLPPPSSSPDANALRRARAELVPDFWWCLFRRTLVPPHLLNGLALTIAAFGLACLMELRRTSRLASGS
ncbi:MAG: hypothetical protein VKQ33_08075 [Candidatus Sericytochromatia bacterium]|nr:hypothetical protein [Candidatus Sericytochromatia bacterium]